MTNLTFKTRNEHDFNYLVDFDRFFGTHEHSYKKKYTDVPHICRLAD